MVFEGAIEKSQELGRWYGRVAAQAGVSFFDASGFAECSEIDGIHLDDQNHHKLAEAIYRHLETL